MISPILKSTVLVKALIDAAYFSSLSYKSYQSTLFKEVKL